MGSISSAIELQDNFTNILMPIINAVNMSVSTMEQMQATMSEPIDTSAIQGIRDQLVQATLATQEFDAAMQNIDSATLPVTTSFADSPSYQPDPVKAPVTWQADNLEIFTNTGIDRFEMEIQSANDMLNALNQTQEKIIQHAADMDFLPPGGIADLTNMQNRLQAIQQRIQMIENNPLNMGTDAANAELEALRGQLDQTVQEQQKLNRAVENMDMQEANEAYLRLSQTVGNTERYIRDNVDEQGRFNREIREGTNEADGLMQTIRGAVAAYVTIQSLSSALNLSDQLVSTAARLNMMNDGLQTTQDLQNMIFLSAERARGSYQATADAVSKLGLMAGDAFGSSEEIIAFMEQINKQFVIAGTEASGIDAAMLQLTQAMGSGVLRGEEYNSILEQAPNIIQAIADYMEVPKGQLKDMAAEGQITADIVKAAMFASADETNAKFESMPKTFEQIWTSFENHALMAFQPVLRRMNEIGNSESFQVLVNNAIDALSVVAGLALEIFDLMIGGAQLVSDNWSWLSPIIYGVAVALAVYYGWQLEANAIEAVSHGIHIAMAAAQMMHAAATGTLTAATAAEIAAQNGLNAAMYACPIVWIVVLVIALVAAFYAAIAAINKFEGTSISATGVIAGVFASWVAFVINRFIMIYNYVASLVEWFANVWTHPVYATKKLFVNLGNMILDFCIAATEGFDEVATNLANAFISGANLAISGINWIIDALNHIPGINIDNVGELEKVASITSSMRGVKDDLASWLGPEPEDYTSINRLDYISVGDAWDAGYSFGKGIEDTISNFDPASLFAIDGIPSAEDYAGALTAGGIGGGIADIAENTGAMADAMDITQEELKYLRDIAEQEAVNRFTTAEINIEQTNHNTIKNGMDLDGVVSGLDDALGEAIEIMTEGVHA
ncbi:MAG: tape measure protein [Lachnospiraceae bacterium]|nr:tape measure protein [Lachnospiraceae bacterium]